MPAKYSTINSDNIRELVDQFYDCVRTDELLGPIFLKILGDDWSAHLDRISEFWATVMLGTRNFHGNVYATHMKLMNIEPQHFQRWLGLFEESANRMFETEPANRFLFMARRVAASLQSGFLARIGQTAQEGMEATPQNQ